MRNSIIIYLLPNIQFITLEKNKNKYIYIYNNNFFFFININNYLCHFKKILNVLELKNLYIQKYTNMSRYLNNFLFSWNHIFSKKITFSGKGFKIRKKRNYLFLFFNRSHASLLICNNIIIKKIQKNKILFFFKNWIVYENIFKNIIKIRPASIYTKRGLRFSRQIILKRKGKGGVQTQQ